MHIVHLKGSYHLIWSRLSLRQDHYMKPQMLRSRFKALEELASALTCDLSLPIPEIVQAVVKRLA